MQKKSFKKLIFVSCAVSVQFASQALSHPFESGICRMISGFSFAALTAARFLRAGQAREAAAARGLKGSDLDMSKFGDLGKLHSFWGYAPDSESRLVFLHFLRST